MNRRNGHTKYSQLFPDPTTYPSPSVSSPVQGNPINFGPNYYNCLLLNSLSFCVYPACPYSWEKAMAPHSSTLAWKILWTEEPGRLQSMGSLRVGPDWVTSISLFTFMHWRRKWQPIPVFLPGESQGWGSLVGWTRLKWLSSSSPYSNSNSFSRSVMSDSLWPQGLYPARILCPWDSPGKNTGVGCHFLIQKIFPTQESNSGLLCCKKILYCLSYREVLTVYSQLSNWSHPIVLLAQNLAEPSNHRVKAQTFKIA